MLYHITSILLAYIEFNYCQALSRRWRLSWIIDNKTFCWIPQEFDIYPGIYMTAQENTNCCEIFYYYPHESYASSWVEALSGKDYCISIEKKNGTLDGRKLTLDLDCGRYNFRGRRDGMMELMEDPNYCTAYENGFNVLRPCESNNYIVDGDICYQKVVPPVVTSQPPITSPQIVALSTEKNGASTYMQTPMTIQASTSVSISQKVFTSLQSILQSISTPNDEYDKITSEPIKSSFLSDKVSSETIKSSYFLLTTSTATSRYTATSSSIQFSKSITDIKPSIRSTRNILSSYKTIEKCTMLLSKTSTIRMVASSQKITSSVKLFEMSIRKSKQRISYAAKFIKSTVRFEQISVSSIQDIVVVISSEKPSISSVQSKILSRTDVRNESMLKLKTTLSSTNTWKHPSMGTSVTPSTSILIDTSSSLKTSPIKRHNSSILFISTSYHSSSVTSSSNYSSRLAVTTTYIPTPSRITVPSTYIPASSRISATTTYIPNSSRPTIPSTYIPTSLDSDLYTKWAPWSDCIGKCGDGYQQRTRQCIYKVNKVCKNVAKKETKHCSLQECPVDGGLTKWTSWSKCTKLCGVGEMIRTRACENPKPVFRGKDCFGMKEEKRICNVQFCPVEGGWSEWSPFTECNKPCNNGTIMNVRECKNPTPKYEGLPCKGSNKQFKECNLQNCSEAIVDLLLEFGQDFGSSLYHANVSAEEFITKNLLSFFNEDESEETLLHINITNMGLLNSSWVDANIRLTFNALDFTQLVSLTHAIKEYGKIEKLTVKNKLKMQLENAPKVTPINIEGTSATYSSLFIEWEEKGIDDNLTYTIFYKKKEASISNYQAIGANCCNATIYLLEEGQQYDIRVVPYNSHGNGVPSDNILLTTIHHAPDAIAKNLTLIEDQLDYHFWWEIDSRFKRSSIKGYKIQILNTETKYFLLYNSTEPKLINVQINPSTSYIVDVNAYNDYGDGERNRFHIKSSGRGPSAAPRNITLSTLSEDTSGILELKWETIDLSKQNGVLIKYCFLWNEVSILRSNVKMLRECVLPYTTRLLISNIHPFHQVNMTVWGVNQYGEGVKSNILFQGSIRCPNEIFTSYLPMPPYTCEDSTGDLKCLFYSILRNATKHICQTNVIINTKINGKGGWSKKLYLYQLKDDIESNVDVSFPVNGFNGYMSFKTSVFVPILQHPGIVVFAVQEDASHYIKEAGNAIIKCWPILSINIVLIVSAGICIWFLEKDSNAEFPITFLKGINHGMWWAFVSSTTLGYGDKTPRTTCGRIFSMAWIIIGITSLAILNGFLSSSFNAHHVATSQSVYGKKVGAVLDSREYRMAIRRNAITNTARNYTSALQLKESLLAGEVDYIFVNAYTAKASHELLHTTQMKIVKVIKDTSAYGFMFSEDYSGFSAKVMDYVNVHQSDVVAFVEKYGEPLQEHNSEATAVFLFDQSSPLFKSALNLLGGSLLLMLVIGWVYRLKTRFVNKIEPEINGKSYTQYHESLIKLGLSMKDEIKVNLIETIDIIYNNQIIELLNYDHSKTPSYKGRSQFEVLDIPSTYLHYSNKEEKPLSVYDEIPKWFLLNKQQSTVVK